MTHVSLYHGQQNLGSGLQTRLVILTVCVNYSMTKSSLKALPEDAHYGAFKQVKITYVRTYGVKRA